MRKMDKKWIIGVSIAVLLAGCGPRSTGNGTSQTGTLRGGLGSSSGGVAVPSSKSISSVAPSLIGNFAYSRTACIDSSGNSTPQPYMLSSNSETIVINDRTVVDTYELSNGCNITYQYDVAGVDSKILSLTNLRVNIMARNGSDENGQCSSSVMNSSSSTQVYSFQYIMSWDPSTGTNSLSLLSAPVGECQSNEWTQDVYRRL